ncbi:MAG TPA: PAN domain-containing protein, partial [Caulobacter sp.]|nr:PAN domain-containing protein [Caulobacter sp.]
MRYARPLGLVGLFAAVICVLSPSGAAQADVETMMGLGVNLPGHDIHSYALQSPDPGYCRLACDQNAQCQSWTFVKPGAQGPNAMCWLKGTANIGGVQDQSTISGIKNGAGGPYPGGARVENGMMLGINLSGGDIASLALPTGNPELCRQACDGRGDCRSWTFVKPGGQGPQAMCWLKGSVPGATFHNGVISGVKGQGGGGGGAGGGGGGIGGPGAGAWGVW